MSFSKIKFILFSLFCVLHSIVAFTVHWNDPTQQCLRNYGQDFTQILRNYGIVVNNGDKFQGNSMTIFYENQLGLYPEILTNGTFANGGLPQVGNLTKHLEEATKTIQSILPDKNFNGVGVIDWEAWRPSWNFNWVPLKIYQEKSKELAKQHHPSLNHAQIEELAKSQFEKGARLYMLETLLLVRKLRPLASWGYYLFPDCYNYVGRKPQDFECSKKVKAENDKLNWLWKSSTALHPSIYLYDNHLKEYTSEQRSWKDNGKLQEGVRVASSDAKILPYVNYFLKKEVVPQEDFQRIVAQIASIGADGLVLWGSSSSVNSKARCDGLKNYIIDTLGPAIERVTWSYNICSKRICNGNGSCTWPNDKLVIAWKQFLEANPSFHPGDIVCRCKSKYTGRFCDKLS